VPITEADLTQRTRRAATGGGPGHEVSGNVLQTLVRDELIYQKGLQLGLDRQPEYQVRLEELEAQVRAFQRQEMSSLYRAYVQQQAAVTEADAQAFFDKSAPFIQSRFHVLQIFYKGKHDEILKDREALTGGAPFEKVASRRFAGLPQGTRPPWDLGELSWSQIPKAWRGVVERLEPGQVSDIIKGDNERYWVIKVLRRRIDPGVTFATERERIGEVLRQQKADDLYGSLLSEMKEKARIVFPE